MKGVDAEKMDKLIEELRDCELNASEPVPGEPIGEKEACVMEVLSAILKKPEDLKLLEEYLDEVEEWKGIRAPDSSADGQYGLWLGPDTENPDAATEITSQNGDYEVCDYASIVGLDFPKKLEERTPFLKTCTTVAAPNIRAAFVRGTKHLQYFGGDEEFVEDVPRTGD